MKEQFETACLAKTLYLWTVKKPANRLLGIAANRYQQGVKKTTDYKLDKGK